MDNRLMMQFSCGRMKEFLQGVTSLHDSTHALIILLLLVKSRIDGLGNIREGGQIVLAGTADHHLAIDKYTRGGWNAQFSTRLGILGDLAGICVCLKTGLEGGHIQSDLLGKSQQASIRKGACIFTQPVGEKHVVVIPEATLG